MVNKGLKMARDYSIYSIEHLIKEFNTQKSRVVGYKRFHKKGKVIVESIETELDVIKKQLLIKIQEVMQDLRQADICNLQIIKKTLDTD